MSITKYPKRDIGKSVVNGLRTRTFDYWRFIGTDGSKGFQNGKVYLLEVEGNHDPHDFFVHVNPHVYFLNMFKTWGLDDTFYNSYEDFDANWEHKPKQGEQS